MNVACRFASVALVLGSASWAFAQCPSNSATAFTSARRNIGASASSASAPGSRPTTVTATRRQPGVACFAGLPQVSSPFPPGMTSLQAFQTQQAMAQRLLAVSAVRNRRTAARHQQMIEINAEKAYQAGLNAEKAGRPYTALRRYERAAEIAPGTLAARYAEDAIARLSAR